MILLFLIAIMLIHLSACSNLSEVRIDGIDNLNYANILKIDYQYLNTHNYIVGLIILVIISTIYIISNYIVSTIKRKEVVTDDNN